MPNLPTTLCGCGFLDDIRRAAAVAGQEQTQRQLIQDLVDRAFGGSAAQLVLRALSADGTSDAELKEIRKLIDDYREKR